MKGMQKISRGSGFDEVLAYAFGNPSARLLGTSQGMMSTNEAGLREEFKAARHLQPGINKAVWHQALRLPPDDLQTHATLLQIAHDYMAKMGFDTYTHQYAVIAHGIDHVHIIASRVGLDGKIWTGGFDDLRSIRIIQELEIAYGLKRTKGLEFEAYLDSTGREKHRIKKPEIRRPKRNELMRHERLQKQFDIDDILPRDRMVAILQNARRIGAAHGFPSFLAAAESQGLAVRATFKDESRTEFKGLVFELPILGTERLRLSGSAVGAGFSGTKILAEAGQTASDLALLRMRDIPFDPMRYVKPVWAVKHKPRAKSHEHKINHPGLAETPTAAPSRCRTHDELPTFDGLRALPVGVVVREGRLEGVEAARLLQDDEHSHLESRPGASSAGLRLRARESGEGSQGAGQGGRNAGQARSQVGREFSDPGSDVGRGMSNTAATGGTFHFAANAAHAQARPAPAPAQRLSAEMRHALALEARNTALLTAPEPQSTVPPHSHDRPYIDAASAFSRRSHQQGTKLDAHAWKAWDEEFGITAAESGGGDAEDILNRLSPGAVASVEAFEVQLSAAAEVDPIVPDYGRQMVQLRRSRSPTPNETRSKPTSARKMRR